MAYLTAPCGACHSPCMTDSFDGAKLALVCRGRVLTLLRDDRTDIPWPGMWDLPGGGREGAEAPLDCALREAQEEIGLSIPPERVTFRQRYDGPRVTWFFGAIWDELPIRDLRLGSEGQAWAMPRLSDFLNDADAIPHLRDRTAEFAKAAQLLGR